MRVSSISAYCFKVRSVYQIIVVEMNKLKISVMPAFHTVFVQFQPKLCTYGKKYRQTYKLILSEQISFKRLAKFMNVMRVLGASQ